MAKEPTARFSQPGALANAYHQVGAPNDTGRTSFVITPPRPVSEASVGAREVERGGEGLYGRPPSPIARPASRPPARISRRRALTLLAAGGGGVVVVAAVALIATHPFGGSTAPTTQSTSQTTNASGHAGTVLARTSDVPPNSAKQFPIANSSNPGLLIHLPSNQFVAFDSTCTHAGCAVSYNPQDHLLDCPCHGAVFDPAKNAAVVNGPATTPLAPIKITVNADGTITTT